MTTVRPCLWFDHGQARKFAEFCAATFPDSHVETAYAAGTDYPDGVAGDELVVDFTVIGMKAMGLNGGPNTPFTDAVSFQIETADQAETDLYWDAIVGSGGSEVACGWCKDGWGFAWQIIPRRLNELMADSDRAKAGRVMAAMMTMRRIDVAAIEAAAREETQ